MSVETKTVVLVSCDVCHEPDIDSERSTPIHYYDVAEATRYLTQEADQEERWQVDEDGTWTCNRCLARAACERRSEGHDWTPWSVYDGRAFRHCQRSDYCGGYESKDIQSGVPL